MTILLLYLLCCFSISWADQESEMAQLRQCRFIEMSPIPDDSSYIIKYSVYYKPIASDEISRDTIVALVKLDSRDTLYGMMFYMKGNKYDYMYSRGTLKSWNKVEHTIETTDSNYSELGNYSWSRFYPMLNVNYMDRMIRTADERMESDSTLKLFYNFKNDSSIVIDSMQVVFDLKSRSLPATQHAEFYFSGFVQVQHYELLEYQDTILSTKTFSEIENRYKGYDHKDKLNLNTNDSQVRSNDSLILHLSRLMEYKVESINGATNRIGEMAAQDEGIILKFWYLRCPPCLLADKEIMKMEQEHRRKVIGINIYDSKEEIIEYLQANDYEVTGSKQYLDVNKIYEDIGVHGYPTFIYLEKEKVEVKEGWSQERLDWIRAVGNP